MDSREVFLAHHGILGQRKGVRNGPPYPLRDSDHSASEKKAGWRKSLAAGKAPAAKTTLSGKGKIRDAIKKYKDGSEERNKKQEEREKEREQKRREEEERRKEKEQANREQKQRETEEAKKRSEERKAEREEKQREEKQKEKQEIIDSADIKKILENKERLTTDELRAAKEKAELALELEKTKRATIKNKTDSALETLRNTANTIKDAANAGVALYDAYNKLKPKEKDKTSTDTSSQKILKDTLDKIGKTKITDENVEEILKEVNKSIDAASILRDAEVMSKDPSVVSVKSKVKKSK